MNKLEIKMTNEDLIAEVIAYYENPDHPFSYRIAALLGQRGESNAEWKSLRDAYIAGEFTPSNCVFMWNFVK
jgi:hypothetical protein